jgi:ketosteroid isomerase-like protein
MTDVSITSEERIRITELISRYAQALDAGDVEGVLECMKDGVSLSYNGGQLRVEGKSDARKFFTEALSGPSTHLLGNYLLERDGDALRASCSGIAFVTRHTGKVTVRGLLYTFICRPEKCDFRIESLEHRANWEYLVAGGPSGAHHSPDPGS